MRRRAWLAGVGASLALAAAPRLGHAAVQSVRCGLNNYFLRASGTFPAVSAFTACGWFRVRTHGGTTGIYLILLSPGVAGNLSSLTLTRPSAADGPAELFALIGGVENASDFGGVDAGLNTWFFMAMAQTGTGSNALAGYYALASDPGLTTAHIDGPSFTPNTLGVAPTVSATDYFDGDVAAVKLWSAVLSPTEIAAERFQYSPQRLANLNSWYPLDTLTGQDQSGNGNHLTVFGSPTLNADGPPISGGPAPPSASGAGRFRVRY